MAVNLYFILQMVEYIITKQTFLYQNSYCRKLYESRFHVYFFLLMITSKRYIPKCLQTFCIHSKLHSIGYVKVREWSFKFFEFKSWKINFILLIARRIFNHHQNTIEFILIFQDAIDVSISFRGWIKFLDFF
jgi:hypothetical protein